MGIVLNPQTPFIKSSKKHILRTSFGDVPWWAIRYGLRQAERAVRDLTEVG